MTQVTNTAAPSLVRELREEMGLTLAEMGRRCGISKSQMHEVERTGRASLPVALAIEALSLGQIDAGDLNEDVRAARHALLDSAAAPGLSPGKAGGNSRLFAQGDA